MEEFKINESAWVEYHTPKTKELWLCKIIDDADVKTNGLYGIRYVQTGSYDDENIKMKWLHKKKDVLFIKNKKILHSTQMAFPNNVIRMPKVHKKKYFKESLKQQKEISRKGKCIKMNKENCIHKILMEYIECQKKKEKKKDAQNTTIIITQIEEIFNKSYAFKLITNKAEFTKLMQLVNEKRRWDLSNFFGIHHLYRLIAKLHEMIYFDKEDTDNLNLLEKEIEKLVDFLEIKKYK